MKAEPKVIIDTNVFVSALIGKSKTLCQLYDAFVDSKFTPILSLEMLAELFEVLHRPKLKKYLKVEEIERLEELIKADAISVISSQKVNISRNHKDNILLECAIASEVRPDFLVTGDKDLLVLKTFRSIPVINPKKFLQLLAK